MQFDVTGFLIFLAFILPGFVAQKSRKSVVPESLKPLSPVSEVGEFVLSGVWVHAFLVVCIRLFFLFFAKQYFALLSNTFRYSAPSNFFWNHWNLALSYFIFSLGFGYCLGFLHGYVILTQPVRNWALNRSLPRKFLRKLGISGFLESDPVWYFVLKQSSSHTAIFLEVEMKAAAGFYTGQLMSYGILDDAVKSKDFYLEQPYFKQDRSAKYTELNCGGLLLNFEDMISIQVTRIEADQSVSIEESDGASTSI